jgi:spore coat protein U-like protein
MLRLARLLVPTGLAAAAVFAPLGPSAAQRPIHMRCSVTSAVGMSFGPYDTLAPVPVDSTGFVSFRCQGVGPTDSILIELGRGRGNSIMPRRMNRRGEALEYNLYLDAARTVVWGDGSRGTGVYQTRPVEGRTESVPIYGRIPARQTVTPGQYSDQVMLTIQF